MKSIFFWSVFITFVVVCTGVLGWVFFASFLIGVLGGIVIGYIAGRVVIRIYEKRSNDELSEP